MSLPVIVFLDFKEENMAKKSKEEIQNKPIPKDAVVKGPNRQVIAHKLPASDCAT